MQNVCDKEECNIEYFIPHHAIFLPQSISIPFTVIFNASATSSKGVSLNSILLNGGTVKHNLFFNSGAISET